MAGLNCQGCAPKQAFKPPRWALTRLTKGWNEGPHLAIQKGDIYTQNKRKAL